MDYISAEDVALLNTSHQQKDYLGKYNRHYIDEFMLNFEYMLQVGPTNQSAECMAIFLSFFTRPVWTPVECNVAFQHNYFICERKPTITLYQPSYTHSQMACPVLYTYVHESCWKVYTVRRRVNSYVNTAGSSTRSVTWLSKLFGYLSAWSLGQTTRVQVMVRIKNSHNMSCLKTNGFDIQHFKDWFVLSKCNATYLLAQRKTLIYSNTCEGTYSTK